MQNNKSKLLMFATLSFAIILLSMFVSGATPINLGTASTFAVLGSSTVTNTGLTTVIGDLGLSTPGVSVTGFSLTPGVNRIVLGPQPPVTGVTDGLGIVSGTIFVGDPTADQAHADAAAAYNTLVGATCTTIEPAVAELGGQTLTPGVYCFPSSAAITGTLTLSGNGVYIFKIGSTLVTAASNSNVVLTNGAEAEDVFWAVGSSATLGTNSDFKGTIIAFTSITATTGAMVEGRLLALNGAVTLDSNTITVVGTGLPIPLPENRFGKVTGGGSTSLDKGKDLNFGFNVQSSDGVTFKGQLQYNDKGAGIKLHSDTMTSLFVSLDGTVAIFEGTGTNKGVPVNFIVVVEDNGEPGRSDKFAIKIVDGGAYSRSGTLTAGNIQIHKK